jgi:hypothetical protein
MYHFPIRFLSLRQRLARERKLTPSRQRRRQLRLYRLDDRTVPSVWYVNAAAGGKNNGLNWADALTNPQVALAAADSGDEIWVAAGTYTPTAGHDQARRPPRGWGH